LEEAHPQYQFRNFLKKCCSATAIPKLQFFLKSATSSPQLESFTSAIFSIFLAVEFGRFMKTKIGSKKSHATVPLRQVFGFQGNKHFYIWLLFKTILS
jgi:hypothetical protein